MAATFWPDEVLGFDLETTGTDRFTDRPVAYGLVTVVEGQVTRRASGLVDPGAEIPAEATAVHGITTEQVRAVGLRADQAVEVVTDALLDASGRGVPVVGANLAYDLTIVDVQSRRLWGEGLAEQGWTGPVLDVLVLDRQMDRQRQGRRALVDLCAHYQVTLEAPHQATAAAEASAAVLLAMAARYPELTTWSAHQLHAAQVHWHQTWTAGHDEWRRGRGRPALDPRDYCWPVAPESLEPLWGRGAA